MKKKQKHKKIQQFAIKKNKKKQEKQENS